MRVILVFPSQIILFSSKFIIEGFLKIKKRPLLFLVELSIFELLYIALCKDSAWVFHIFTPKYELIYQSTYNKGEDCLKKLTINYLLELGGFPAQILHYFHLIDFDCGRLEQWSADSSVKRAKYQQYDFSRYCLQFIVPPQYFKLFEQVATYIMQFYINFQNLGQFF